MCMRQDYPSHIVGTLLLVLIWPLSVVAEQTGGNSEFAQVEVRQVGGTVPIGGTVVPHKDVTFTAQVPGSVEFIAGEEGDQFQQGVVLVRLDAAQLRARRQAALAQIANAEAALRNAGVQYDRERRSPQSRSMMDQFMPGMGQWMGGPDKVQRRADLYSESVQVEQSRNALYQAQSQLGEIDAKLKDTASIAPFNGVIVKKFVNQGDTVQPGQPLINYAVVRALQLQVDVPARLAPLLRPGDRILARLDDVNKTEVPARVSRVFPMADPTRHTVRVKLDLPQNVPAAAGMYAELLVNDPTAVEGKFPIIPISAVTHRGGLPMVYVLRPDGTNELRLLRLGDRVDRDHVIVLTGLVGGEKVRRQPGR
ncbi:MAG: efflux RND transporter periplasmic adaptor subunit [Gammaproteobacteria bacterium]|nr:efflux RND transporter periplasmic adaptor subunit [Gammaproteobacteria bacterium]